MSKKWGLFRITVFICIVMSFISFPVLAGSPPAIPNKVLSWYGVAGWTYRKSITIDHTKVSADLASFPVLVSITDSNLASHARADGYDILFTDSGGSTKLNHEIELYTSATGKLVAWVNVPNVSSSVNTVLYMYYGNASASNQQNPTAVSRSPGR